MNRREFFRRTLPAVAVTVAASQCGWSLESFKRLLARVLHRTTEATYSAKAVTIAMLSAQYKRTTVKLYKAYSFRVREYDWIGPEAFA